MVLQVPRVNSEPQMASHSTKPANPKPAQNNTKPVSTPQQSAPPPPKSSTTGDLIGLGNCRKINYSFDLLTTFYYCYVCVLFTMVDIDEKSRL